MGSCAVVLLSKRPPGRISETRRTVCSLSFACFGTWAQSTAVMSGLHATSEFTPHATVSYHHGVSKVSVSQALLFHTFMCLFPEVVNVVPWQESEPTEIRPDTFFVRFQFDWYASGSNNEPAWLVRVILPLHLDAVSLMHPATDEARPTYLCWELRISVLSFSRFQSILLERTSTANMVSRYPRCST